MRFSVMFEAPGSTLFLFECDYLRMIDNEGGEALLPLVDFFALLIHLAAHSAALQLSPPASDWLSLLAASMRHDINA